MRENEYPAARLVGDDLPYGQQFFEGLLLFPWNGDEKTVGLNGDAPIGEADFAVARHTTLTALADTANHGQRLADGNRLQKAQL